LNNQEFPNHKNARNTSRFSDYYQFVKFRLSFLVVLSAALSFAFGSQVIDWTRLMYLVIGGFLVTASSNGYNQIIERDLDKLMQRTSNRPLPSGRMSLAEAHIIAFVTGLSGVLILWLRINMYCGVLGLLALVLYVAVYTPLKRKTPFAVFVGAFPGAIPTMLGWVAATNQFGLGALLVFSLQFIWQFPHFWAIAWVLDDDYKKAGFKMLPSEGGRDKSSAFQTVVYTLILIPISLMPFFFHMVGYIGSAVILVCGIAFLTQALKLFRTCEIKAAQQLMFGSFIYLPIVQIALLIDKI
jgi:protoheme IX farnesyltransferase